MSTSRLSLMALLLLFPVAGEAQLAGAVEIPRTPWGRPAFQGVWTNSTLTPLERPAELGAREFHTAAEVAALQRVAVQQRIDALPEPEATLAVEFSEIWMEPGPLSQRTSLVTGPTGKIPLSMVTGHGRATPLLWKTVVSSTLKGNQRRYERLLRSRSTCFTPCLVNVPRAWAKPRPTAWMSLANATLGVLTSASLARDSGHSPRRAATRASEDPALAWRLARALGGRHPGHRDDELQRHGRVQGVWRRTRCCAGCGRCCRPG